LLEFVSPKIQCENSSENYGEFAIEPLESGFGLTIGNALRRVLLGSIPGAAVTAVKIEGVQHEFATIPHVKEDLVEFLFNVRDLRLRPFSVQEGIMQLEFEGEGVVCAGDISPSADFEVVNPELHLATLDSAEAKLNVELHVEMGKGYVPAGSSDGLPLEFIPVDAIFTPTRKVNYTVEKTRVEQVSNYDRLIIEIWTDGVVTPEEALSQAARILVEQLHPFLDLDKATDESEKALPPSVSPEQYEMSVEQLGLSVRTLNALRRSNITKVGELLEKSAEDLLALRSFGQKSLEEVAERLDSLGLLPETPEEEGESLQPQEEDSAMAEVTEETEPQEEASTAEEPEPQEKDSAVAEVTEETEPQEEQNPEEAPEPEEEKQE